MIDLPTGLTCRRKREEGQRRVVKDLWKRLTSLQVAEVGLPRDLPVLRVTLGESFALVATIHLS